MARTVDVPLSDRHAAFVAGEVAAGRARDAAEVVGRGLELALRARARHEAKLARLRAALAEAEAEIERGEVVEYRPGLLDEIFEEASAEPAGPAAAGSDRSA